MSLTVTEASPSLSLTRLPDPCEHLDAASVRTVCPGADQVVIYGWSHCQYLDVDRVLKETIAADPSFPIKAIFSNSLGHPTAAITTLEGRRINVLPFEEMTEFPHSVSRPCKAGITNILLENYKRDKEGLPLIPFLFFIDIDDNPYPLRLEDISSKDPQLNAFITNKELRRVYKLCCHDDPNIRRIADETFRFVKLRRTDDSAYQLAQIDAPWKSPVFARCWEARKALSRSEPKADEIAWRKQLTIHMAEYDRSRSRPQLPVLTASSPSSPSTANTDSLSSSSESERSVPRPDPVLVSEPTVLVDSVDKATKGPKIVKPIRPTPRLAERSEPAMLEESVPEAPSRGPKIVKPIRPTPRLAERSEPAMLEESVPEAPSRGPKIVKPICPITLQC